jgi:hypothetical protein
MGWFFGAEREIKKESVFSVYLTLAEAALLVVCAIMRALLQRGSTYVKNERSPPREWKENRECAREGFVG